MNSERKKRMIFKETEKNLLFLNVQFIKKRDKNDSWLQRHLCIF
jgi:hypothetical protein